MTHTYDAIVIGAGQGGTPLATALARAGRKTAIIERNRVGGTCINTGCTPTKTLLASANVAHEVQRAGDFGVRLSGPVQVDMPAVRARKRAVVEQFREGILRRYQQQDGLDLLHGDARFTGPKTLEVAMHEGELRQLQANQIFIDAGARPFIPPLVGIKTVEMYDEERIAEIDYVPEHLVVLGGGYVGIEFGQMFRRFGSKVTIVQRGAQLLAREDRDVADAMVDMLRAEGITVLLQAEATHVEPTGEGHGIHLTVQTPDGPQTITGSLLLVAAGRTPNTDSLHPEVAGIEMDARRQIKVNDRLETNVPGVYALGDVKGGPAFTHISYDDYRVLCENVLHGGNASIRGRLVPYTVFTDPQLGRVGLTVDEARAQGLNIRVAKIPMNYVARAIETGQTRGLMKAVVDAQTDQILGCAILGPEGGEIMAMIEIAMMGHVPYPALRDGIFAHPTLAEGLNTLFTYFEDD